jgi:glycosyltransferase involved in cell wall biosynthesis
MDGYPLTVVGTGPEEAVLRRRAEGFPGVRFTGELSRDAVRGELARAAFVVAPSLCYENFPLAVVEAMAAGKPVVAPRQTALGDMVEEGWTGLRFRVGQATSLARACRRLASDPALAEAMGREARLHYEDFLTPERSLERLLALYRGVLEECSTEAG